MARKKTIYERANAISVLKVLRDFFDIDHPDSDRPWSGFCPFGFEHADGGMEKDFRTNSETNSAMCFAMHGSLNPVRLIQIRKEWPAKKSALFLLDHYGLLQDKPYPERWAAVVKARKDQAADMGNAHDLVEALRVSLAAHSAYADSQYEDGFITRMETHFKNLDSLLGTEADEEGVREWYQKARTDLIEYLEEMK